MKRGVWGYGGTGIEGYGLLSCYTVTPLSLFTPFQLHRYPSIPRYPLKL
jgi:hypothetical protein